MDQQRGQMSGPVGSGRPISRLLAVVADDVAGTVPQVAAAADLVSARVRRRRSQLPGCPGCGCCASDLAALLARPALDVELGSCTAAAGRVVAAVGAGLGDRPAAWAAADRAARAGVSLADAVAVACAVAA